MSTDRVLDLVEALTLDEKATLLAGADFWNTVAVERLGLPPVRVTDGPAGARGSALLGFGTVSAVCIPCGSALGATWDPELIEEVGAMLGDETRTKAARVLLAPTVNIVRSPLAGRTFECYSEDPLLAGRLAAAFVRGVQSRDVVTTVKHFVGNEAEFERRTISSVIDERTLREIYLVPFELAVREGGSLGIMTAYNRLNGEYCNDRRDLLQEVLRDDWGFEGFVVTDWLAAGSTTTAAAAGVDLEMPGPGRFYGPALAEAVRRGEVAEVLVDAAARRLLSVFQRVGALDDPSEQDERSVDLPEHRALARRAAISSTVLLVNNGLLPFDQQALGRVAVIGPNADRAQIMGGGSAALRPHYRITPLQALLAELGDRVDIVHERGCAIDLAVPPLQGESVSRPDGGVGFDVEFFAGPGLEGDPVGRASFPDSRLLFTDRPLRDIPRGLYSFRATATFTPAESGPHRFTLGQSGKARVVVDGTTVLDGFAVRPPPGTRYFGVVSEDLEADVDLIAGQPVEVAIEYSSEGSTFLRGVLVGCRPAEPPDLLDRAVAAAAEADVALVVVGTNDDWETEGEDRSSLALPGDQDELVARVVAANPNTVVIVNSGSAVTMPWVDRAAAVLQIWFGGQEMSNGLVDILTGAAEPGGRMPMTFPTCIEQTPAFGNFPGSDGEVRYGEGLLVGYRWYDTRGLPVLFPFGHGLSYTSFEVSSPEVVAVPTVFEPGEKVTLRLVVTNTGSRTGTEVVQVYVGAPPGRRFRPAKELRAFEKLSLDAGETRTVELELGWRAFAAWDVTEREWVVEGGSFELHIGRSVNDIAHVVPVEINR
jgi:beta-glucosidase